MTEERVSPLRQRMIEDMRIRGMGDKAQKAHIRAIKDFTAFLGHSPDTATPEELRAYQLHMTDAGVTPSTFNARVVALRFFFGMTCGREEMKRYMQFRTEPRKLPIVLSVEEVSDILMAAPGPGLKYRAALSISYGAGLRAAEVCNLKIGDIDSDRMLIHVELGKGQKDRKVMLSPGLLDLLRAWWREARPEGWLFPIARQAIAQQSAERGQAQDQPDLAPSTEPGVHISQTHGWRYQASDLAHIAAQLCHPFAGSQHRRAGVEDAGPETTSLTLRKPCPCCGGPMRIIEIFRRGQKPMSRAPPREQAA